MHFSFVGKTKKIEGDVFCEKKEGLMTFFFGMC